MQHPMVRNLLAPLAAAVLLAACGGGGVVFIDDDFDDPSSSGRSGSVAVVSPQDTRFSGTYSSDDVRLSETYRFPATTAMPATCRFRFADLRLEGGNAVMNGEIRYRVNSTEVERSALSINGLEYRLFDSGAVVVNKDANRIRFNGATLSTDATPAETITVTGSIPYRGDNLPSGC